MQQIQITNMKTTAIAICLLAISASNLFAQNSGAGAAIPSETGFITVDGGKLYYEVAGKGPNIVLLHDGMVHSAIWDEQFPVLVKEYRVIRYDRRTFGKSSDPTAAYSHIDDLKQVFDQLKIDKAIVFGMSSGGGLAIDFTLKYADRVVGLVLVGAVVGGFRYTAHMGTRGGHMLPAAERSDSRKLHTYFIMDDPYEIYKDNNAVKERVMAMMLPYIDKARGEGIPVKPADRQAVKFLSEIKVPTLVLAGEFDIPDVFAHAGAITAGIRDATLKFIPRSGHLVPIEQPALFNEAVLNFIKWFPK
jgi:pimeloyl-ACP methyl ester carboxylesterase